MWILGYLDHQTHHAFVWMDIFKVESVFAQAVLLHAKLVQSLMIAVYLVIV